MAYLYRHIREDKNEPFYIGIGSDSTYKRANQTKKERRNNIWNKIVSKTFYKVEILFDDLTWEEACNKEKEFIALYGRIDNGTGLLANMTNGGDGSLGIIKSEQTISKLKERMSGKGNPMYGVKHPPELIEQIRLKNLGKTAWNKGLPCLDHVKKALSEKMIGSTPWNKGKPHSLESKLKMSEVKLSKKNIAWNKGLKKVNGISNAKTVFCLQSGIYYESAKEASDILGINYSTLKSKLNGSMKNNTCLIYV
jgi:hypothetical protein